MKKNQSHLRKSCAFAVLVSAAFFISFPAESQVAIDSAAEKKVDYMERIYFSGKDAAGIKTMIQETMQELDGKPATPAVAKQYSFLGGIQTTVENMQASCDILELIAAGIYGLDANEASLQKISRPPATANQKASGVLTNINNTFSKVSAASYQAASTNWYLSGGTASLDAANKIAGAANTAKSVGSVVSTYKDVRNTLGSLGIATGKKPCKNVPKKDIQIGVHVLQVPVDTQAITSLVAQVVVRNINDDKLSALTAYIRKIAGVISVNDDEFSGNTATLMIAHKLSISELIAKIKEDGALNLSVESRSSKNAVLVVK